MSWYTDNVENLVRPSIRGSLRSRLEFEVLAAYTPQEWECTVTEEQMRKLVWAKFRDYDAAELYAQQLASSGLFHKVILRA